ncbi:bifunctional DNA primase/polymerase [Micromonospora sp. NPDC005172]|uniref:bifunctional DNA primase/polymerase n=1 Tax=Micromonospora sp. NPDC005172 TaxID=3156867 RepID=UPI0033A8B588
MTTPTQAHGPTAAPATQPPPPQDLRSEPVLNVALRYATAGIPVMPLHTPQRAGGCSCRRALACPSPGKHPRLRHGLRDASTDPALVRQWWTRWPDANIGLATGSLLDVCDIDTADGLRTVTAILDNAPSKGPVVRTGSGWHLWFAATGHANRVGVIPGVDWRGRGGLVVAPPSLHPTGRRYTFTQQFDRVLPDCPPALRRLLSPPPAPVPEPATATPGRIDDPDRYGLAALNGEIGRILTAPRPVIRGRQRIIAGGRNTALHLAAFRLGQLAAHDGLDAQVVWPRLTEAAHTVGLSADEARATIASGWRAGLRRPRAVTRERQPRSGGTSPHPGRRLRLAVTSRPST